MRYLQAPRAIDHNKRIRRRNSDRLQWSQSAQLHQNGLYGRTDEHRTVAQSLQGRDLH